MDLKKIKRTLDRMGYITQIHNSINSLTIAQSDSDNNPIVGTISRIEVRDGEFIFVYYNGQLPIEKVFFNEKELIKEISQKFPL